tara:strand:+ start:86 stop:1327 length:1242 start_codon:yes stop_codon:yes gene_type:complete
MSQINLIDPISKFSSLWEEYLIDRREEISENKYQYIMDKEHHVYKLFKSIPSLFEKVINKNKYKVKSSLGNTRISAIPWICIFNQEITDSAQYGFYISYLFSHNAKQLYLSIGIAATQFDQIYKGKQCTEKIREARIKFENLFDHYKPLKKSENIQLYDENDTSFIRERKEYLGTSMKRILDYEAGCLFTKKYNLETTYHDNKEFINDLNKYIFSYDSIADDPISTDFIDNIVGSLYKKEEVPLKIYYNYDLPIYKPEKKPQESKLKTNKKSNINRDYKRRSKESKKIGLAGEEYVIEYEKRKLSEQNLSHLADKIIWQSKDYSFFPGYDIKSFNNLGEEIFIEVKSTQGSKQTQFQITDRELEAAMEYGESYFIYCVYNVLKSPKIFAIKNLSKLIEDNDVEVINLDYLIKI